VHRHEALRTRFDTNPRGDLLPIVTGLQRVDLPIRTVMPAEEDPVARVEQLVGESLRRRFDLRHGPLVEAELFRLGLADHLFLVRLHPMVADRESLSIVLAETAAIHDSPGPNVASVLEPPAMQLSQLVALQRERLASGSLATDIEFWRSRLARVQPTDLPTDRPRQGPGGDGRYVRQGVPASAIFPALVDACPAEPCGKG
jgi:hypothetical protein